MSDDLQQTRYDNLIRRVGGIIGPGSKVGAVIPELFPMIDVENVPPELQILSGTQLCMGGGLVAASAAQNGRAQLANPAGSGKLITLDQFTVSTLATTNIAWGRFDTLVANNIDTQVFYDTRNPLLHLPSGVIRTDTSAAGFMASGLVRILPHSPFTLEPRHGVMVLAPGTAFMVHSQLVNVEIRFAFYWRERTALTSELDL